MTSRREMLAMAALAAPSLAMGPRVWATAPGRPELGAASVIREDFVFPEWTSALEAVAARGGAPGDAATLAVLRRHADRARPPASASTTWLSLAAPGVEPFEVGAARTLARLANDRLATAVRRSGGRLAGLATVAASDPHAVDEARRALGLGLAGVSLGANRGWRLEHSNVCAVLDFAAKAGVPVYLPAKYAPLAGDQPYRAEGAGGVLAGAAADSNAHAIQLIFGGVLDEAPNLRVVLARMGDAAPHAFVKLREIERRARMTPGGGPRASVASYFERSLYLTTADMSADTRGLYAARLAPGRLLTAAPVWA